MTQRERYLGLAVGGLLLLLILNFSIRSFVTTLQSKEDLVDSAFSKLQSLNNTISKGNIATNTLRALEVKSLPSQQEAAASQYKRWLMDLAKQSGLTQVQVISLGKPKPVFPAGQPFGTPKAYDIHEFTLSGQCHLEQAIDLLGKFYDRDYLHQVSSLKLIPTRQAGNYTLQLTSKAVSIAKAGSTKKASLESSGRLAMSVDEYKKVILERGPFSPPNKAPVFSTKSQHDVTIGQAWQLSLAANDPEGNSVSFELVTDTSGLPEELTLSDSQLKWKPTEVGEQKVVVRARDSGSPPMTAEITLVLKAVEPAKPATKTDSLDPAQQAYLTGLVTGRSGAQGWIRSRAEDLSIDIFDGADIKVGSIAARVVKIHVKEDFVELETDGVRWTADMSTSLAEAFQKSQVD